MTTITRRNLARGGAAGIVGAIAAPALAQSGKLHWRMVTSWPKRLPGPGMSAERVAHAHRRASGRAAYRSRCRRRARSCRLSRCSTRSAPASPRWAILPRSIGRARSRRRRSSPPCRSALRRTSMSPGSAPAAARSCGTSFTRRSASSRSWPAIPASRMGGWFRRELKSVDDVHGLKMRSLGLGGEVYRRLGAIPQTTRARRNPGGAAVRA